MTPKLEPLDKSWPKREDWTKQQEIREKREKLLADYQRETWLLNAAKRASQIQLVTHAIKYTHGDARGTSALLKLTVILPRMLWSAPPVWALM